MLLSKINVCFFFHFCMINVWDPQTQDLMMSSNYSVFFKDNDGTQNL